jgi:hypothetical protein
MNEAQPPQKAWLLVTRVLAGWFAVFVLTGYAWSPLDTRTPLDNAYFGVTFVALAFFAVVPPRITLRFRSIVAVVTAIAIALSVPQMYQDLTLQGGADYFALALRFIACALLAAMTAYTFKARREAV